MTQHIELVAISAAVALVAYTYAIILTEGGMLLNWWLLFLQKHLEQPAYFSASKGARFKAWLYKPLIGCFKCVAGQLALWYYFWRYSQAYSLPQHVFFVCFAIFISIALDKLHTIWKAHP